MTEKKRILLCLLAGLILLAWSATGSPARADGGSEPGIDLR